MINMSYEVEVSKPDHREVLRHTLAEWSRLDHDVHLISAEGHKVSTSKVLLSLYSQQLRSILVQPLWSSSTAVISTPASASTISSLLELLATGRARGRDLQETTDLARDLGININNCSLENRKAAGQTFLKRNAKLENVNKTKSPKLIKTKIIDPTQTFTISGMNQNNETDEPNLKEEVVENVTKKNLCCDVCGKPFKEKKYLYSHRYRKHGLKSKEKPPIENRGGAGWLRCDVCDKVFKDNKYLSRHRLKYHGLKSKEQPPGEIIEKVKTENYFCDICKTNWETPTDLRKHMLSHLPESERLHQPGDRKVSLSKEELSPFTEPVTLTEETVAEEADKFNVFHPGDPFAEFCDLVIEPEGKTGGHGCGYCEENFKDEDELIQHIVNHHDSVEL